MLATLRHISEASPHALELPESLRDCKRLIARSQPVHEGDPKKAVADPGVAAVRVMGAKLAAKTQCRIEGGAEESQARPRHQRAASESAASSSTTIIEVEAMEDEDDEEMSKLSCDGLSSDMEGSHHGSVRSNATTDEPRSVQSDDVVVQVDAVLHSSDGLSSASKEDSRSEEGEPLDLSNAAPAKEAAAVEVPKPVKLERHESRTTERMTSSPESDPSTDNPSPPQTPPRGAEEPEGAEKEAAAVCGGEGGRIGGTRGGDGEGGGG